MERPLTEFDLIAATPSDASIIDLLGGHYYRGVALTKSQIEELWRVYGFEGEVPQQQTLVGEGDLRDLFREAQIDGLRLMAYLAKHLERGEDPVALVAKALATLGYDVETPDS